MSEIVFVRHYKTKGSLHEDVYDVLYETGRLYTFFRLPKTVERFIASANSITEREDELWGHEVIYKRW